MDSWTLDGIVGMELNLEEDVFAAEDGLEVDVSIGGVGIGDVKFVGGETGEFVAERFDVGLPVTFLLSPSSSSRANSNSVFLVVRSVSLTQQCLIIESHRRQNR